MNDGMTECAVCDCDPCACRIVQGKKVAEIGIDVFTKVRRWRMKVIKWIWPDIQRLADALYDYWDKSPPNKRDDCFGPFM